MLLVDGPEAADEAVRLIGAHGFAAQAGPAATA